MEQLALAMESLSEDDNLDSKSIRRAYNRDGIDQSVCLLNAFKVNQGRP